MSRKASEWRQNEARASQELSTQRQRKASRFSSMRCPLNFFPAWASEKGLKYREGWLFLHWILLELLASCAEILQPRPSLFQQLGMLAAEGSQPRPSCEFALCQGICCARAYAPPQGQSPLPSPAAFHTSQVLLFPRALPAKFPLLPGTGLRLLPTSLKNVICQNHCLSNL